MMKKTILLAAALATCAMAEAQFVIEKTDGSTFEVNGNVTFSHNADYTESSIGSVYDPANDLSTIKSITYATPSATVKVGDYYYHDGSFASEYDPSLNKKVIGVVFYVGDPTADDAALAADHPGCTHGLVVGLKQRKCEWQDNYGDFDSEADMTVGDWIAENTDYPTITSGTALDDPINKSMGYSNTKGIDEFNDSDYGWDYEVLVGGNVSSTMTSYKAPAESSGWFVPSAKQLSLLISGPYDGNIDKIGYDDESMTAVCELVNSKLAVLTGAAQVDGVYWSSNEYTVSQVYTLLSKNGLLMQTSKGGSNFLRPILAF